MASMAQAAGQRSVPAAPLKPPSPPEHCGKLRRRAAVCQARVLPRALRQHTDARASGYGQACARAPAGGREGGATRQHGAFKAYCISTAQRNQRSWQQQSTLCKFMAPSAHTVHTHAASAPRSSASRGGASPPASSIPTSSASTPSGRLMAACTLAISAASREASASWILRV